MTHPAQWTAIGSPSASSASRPADTSAGFVINLCASATPLALARPKGPEFAGYAFFVSRRVEGGRERFRLHMGHFASRDAAERLLPAIREHYPAAWVGEAPARSLRTLPEVETTPGPASTAPPRPSEVEVLAPQDTQTWNDIRAQLKREAPVHFAVQLLWSVTPIDLAALPKLAIFDAYTLYRIEGNRDGRKWYGLRLGFFTDSDAAKQVATYVRAEFSQVAVVPVSAREREQAAAVAAAPRQEPAPAPVPLRRAAPAATPANFHRSRVQVDDEAALPRRSFDETLDLLGANGLSLCEEGPSMGSRSGLGNVGAPPSAPHRSRFAGFLDRLFGRG